jgi:uncharacterized protein (DUF302 family)
MEERNVAMSDYDRRIVIDLGFETVVGEVSRAIREEGLQTIARIDVRDHFWRDLGHDFRQYFLIQAWSPELALEALQHDLDVGTIVPATFAMYELADGQTAVVAREPFSPLTADPEWRRAAPELAAIAHREAERVARVLARLQHAPSHHASELPAA